MSFSIFCELKEHVDSLLGVYSKFGKTYDACLGMWDWIARSSSPLFVAFKGIISSMAFCRY